MKINKTGLIFLVAGLIYLISFFRFLPTALKMEGWADIWLSMISTFLIFGLVLINLGIYYTVRSYRKIIQKKLLITLGCISLLFGLFFSLILFPYALLLFIPGIFMIYFGFKEEDYFNSSKFHLDLVISFGVFIVGFISIHFILAIQNFIYT